MEDSKVNVIGVEPEFAAEVDGGIEETDAMDQLVAHGDTNVLQHQKAPEMIPW